MDLQTTEPPKAKIKLNKKQSLFMEMWTQPDSPTFGNVYKSGLASGFSPTYSRNIANVAPQWLLTFMDKVDLRPEHIKQGITKIATGEINSRSVDDTRLKAYELLGRYAGMDKDKQVNITVVQPILGGVSERTNPKTVDSTTKPVDTTSHNE